MAAEVAGRRRHFAGWAVRGGALPCCCGGAAKSLRILICSLQTNNSELPMRRLPSRGCVFAMPFPVLKASLGQPRLIALNGAV